VTNDGLVSALVPGYAAITATGPGGQKRSASITVVAVPALTSGTGVTVSGSGARGSQQFRKIIVPAGMSNLEVTIRGGSGDVDLYVSRGGVPTTSNFGCRSWNGGNTEDCNFPNPVAGTYFIMLDLWDPYAGARLTATYTP
jgi:serine protease